ncbi:MAG: hypothetical protein JSW17_02645 [Candidatus Omnitrophota bacterium]|nr:MAG: hypothetical protein JSW17_02645 [Candidatus Omnitrophota bacterium]
MKTQGLVSIMVVVFLSLSFYCLGQDYKRDSSKYFSKDTETADSHGEDEESEFDYLFEDTSLISVEEGYSATPQSNSFIDSYSDPSLEGYGYLSGFYEHTEYDQPTEDFYYYHEPKIPSPPTPPNLLYQIMRRSRDR